MGCDVTVTKRSCSWGEVDPLVQVRRVSPTRLISMHPEKIIARRRDISILASRQLSPALGRRDLRPRSFDDVWMNVRLTPKRLLEGEFLYVLNIMQIS